MEFGRSASRTIRAFRAGPSTRAAVAKSASRSCRNCPRTIRHGTVHVIRPIMIIMLMMPGPRTADRDEQQDDRREAHDDVDDPHDAEVRRAVEARDGAEDGPDQRRDQDATRPTSSETRPPTSVRASMSRPLRSVPSQCSGEGGLLACARFCFRRRRLGCRGAPGGSGRRSRPRRRRPSDASRTGEGSGRRAFDRAPDERGGAVVRMGLSLRRSSPSASTDARVGDGIRHVGEEIGEEDEDGDDQAEPHDHRVVALRTRPRPSSARCPGQQNTVSMMTAPPTSSGSESPMIVMIGISAVRNACASDDDPWRQALARRRW